MGKKKTRHSLVPETVSSWKVSFCLVVFGSLGDGVEPGYGGSSRSHPSILNSELIFCVGCRMGNFLPEPEFSYSLRSKKIFEIRI